MGCGRRGLSAHRVLECFGLRSLSAGISSITKGHNACSQTRADRSSMPMLGMVDTEDIVM